MDRNIIVKTWIASVTLLNGQTVEQEIQAKSIKKARLKLRKDSQIAKIVNVKAYCL